MAKYLTATKICTLVLVELYLTEPLETYSSEVGNGFLALVSERIISNSGYGNGTGSYEYILPPANANDFASQLRGLPAAIPGRSCYDEFVKRLWLVEDLDALHSLFERCDAVLPPVIHGSAPPPTDERGQCMWKATRASLIGQFLRRCSIGFTRLQYEDSIALWHSFVAYRAATYDEWAHKTPESRRSTLGESSRIPDTLLGAVPTVSQTSSILSPDDVESMLGFAIHHLQKLGQRVPEQLREKIQQWLAEQRETGVQYLHHFMAFFESWRAGQYNMALENLHRYFDYSLASKGTGDNMKVYYQYALLHLSVLHADFERWEESVSAMEECISTARENQDTACLNFASSWLLYLRQAHNMKDSQSLRSLAALAGEGGNEQDELTFLKAKAKESKHWSLMSSTLLEEAKFEMRRTGVAPKPFEHTLQAAYLNLQHSSFSLIPSSTVFLGGTYERLGQTHISSQVYRSIQPIYGYDCSLGDQVRAQCRLALSAARNGAYTQAMASLAEMGNRVKGTLKLEQRVTVMAWIVELMKQIRRENFEAARYHLSKLLPARAFSDPELVAQINLLEIDLLMKQRRFDSALTKTNILLSRLHSHPEADIAETLHLLVLKADVFAAAGMPTKGFSLAIRAASTAERCRLTPVLLEALASLASILNDVAEFQAARSLCEAVLPKAYEIADAQLMARMVYILMKAHVGVAGQSDEGVRVRHIRTALAYIDRGREAFSRIGDLSGQLDCLAIKGKLARFNNDEASASQADAMYFQLMTDHEAEGGAMA